MKTRSQGILISVFLSLLSVSVFADEAAAPPLVDRKEKAFKKDLGVQYDIAPDTDTLGVVGQATAFILGKERVLIDWNVKPTTDLLEGESEFRMGGVKVYGGKVQLDHGALTYNVGFAPALVRLPLVAVPVGPLMVKVDAGLGYELNLDAKLTPEISIPIEFSAISATVHPEAKASAFVEGYAQFIALRGGVGGQVDLVDADATATGRISVGRPAQFTVSGMVRFLAGRFYGFADFFNIFGWRWKRFWDATIFQWKGYCKDFNPEGGLDRCTLPPESVTKGASSSAVSSAVLD